MLISKVFKYFKSVIVLLPAVILLQLLSSCASTNIGDVWVNENFEGRFRHNIIVLGVSNNLNRRRLFENSYVNILEDYGVNAAASYNFVSSQSRMEKEQALKIVRDNNFDGILITRVVSISKTGNAYHAYLPTIPSTSYYSNFYSYYYSAYNYAVNSTQYSVTSQVKLETNLYDVDTEELIWTGVSKTYYPNSIEETINEVQQNVIETLIYDKIIK